MHTHMAPLRCRNDFSTGWSILNRGARRQFEEWTDSRMTNRKKLIIFTRYPEPGTTKTRMIGALGAKGAAELHRQMAEWALGVACELRAAIGIAIEIGFAGSDDSKMRQWLGNDVAYAGQIGLDLGERMDNAFKAGFEQGYDRIVIMGSDCPGLTADILQKAFRALDSHPVVLGPASDGGYYLVGLKHQLTEIFQNIPWGSGSVLEETCKALATLEISCALLERLSDVDTPEDLHVWESVQKVKQCLNFSLSIIIPALNESAQIQATVQSARKGLPLEVIVVDGGSRDETVQVASEAGATVIQAPRGRAVQMNAGAGIARGSHLLFLHADTRLPEGYPDYVRSIMNDSAAGGAFRFGIAQPFPGRGLVERMTNLRSRLFQMPYGDQAIFIRRRDFVEMGGYKPLPIMEDYDFIQRLKHSGRIVIADAVAMTSGRRWLELGALRTTLINQLVIAGYRCGVAPDKLALFYRNKKRGGFIP
jgi:rSAM/selenodomain-associated transferase 2/rSAM/selenodomain-associated transferase 1